MVIAFVVDVAAKRPVYSLFIHAVCFMGPAVAGEIT